MTIVVRCFDCALPMQIQLGQVENLDGYASWVCGKCGREELAEIELVAEGAS